MGNMRENPGPLCEAPGNLERRAFLRLLVLGAAGYAGGFGANVMAGGSALRPVRAVPFTPFTGPPGSWTLVVLPDTQYYSRDYPEVFIRQTEWIVRHRREHNILFVAHEGDIVNNNNPPQWAQAQAAMRILVKGRVPFALLPGNHDLGKNGRARTRSTHLNKFFNEADYRHSPQFGLFQPGRMQNSWHAFETPTGPHLVLALEFGPRDEVLQWANEVVATRPGHRVMVVTHAYLGDEGRRQTYKGGGPGTAADSEVPGGGNPHAYGLAQKGTVNDGQQVWDKLVSRHANICFVFNGHTCGRGHAYLRSTGHRGTTVHQMLANYQDSGGSRGTVQPPHGYGGGGYLRLVQFPPDGRRAIIRTYSPWYDNWLETAGQEMVLPMQREVS